MPETLILSGAPEGFDARVILEEIARTGATVCHIARDDKRAEAMRAALASRVVPLPIAPGLLSASRMADQTVQIYRDAFARRGEADGDVRRVCEARSACRAACA